MTGKFIVKMAIAAQKKNIFNIQIFSLCRQIVRGSFLHALLINMKQIHSFHYASFCSFMHNYFEKEKKNTISNVQSQ